MPKYCGGLCFPERNVVLKSRCSKPHASLELLQALLIGVTKVSSLELNKVEAEVGRGRLSARRSFRNRESEESDGENKLQNLTAREWRCNSDELYLQ